MNKNRRRPLWALVLGLIAMALITPVITASGGTPPPTADVTASRNCETPNVVTGSITGTSEWPVFLSLRFESHVAIVDVNEDYTYSVIFADGVLPGSEATLQYTVTSTDAIVVRGSVTLNGCEEEPPPTTTPPTTTPPTTTPPTTEPPSTTIPPSTVPPTTVTPPTIVTPPSVPPSVDTTPPPASPVEHTQPKFTG